MIDEEGLVSFLDKVSLIVEQNRNNIAGITSIVKLIDGSSVTFNLGEKYEN